MHPSLDEAVKAYDAGQCDLVSADIAALHVARAKLARPGDHAVLPELITKAPAGPIVRQGDDQWFNIVRWTHFAMLNAEELGINSANVDDALRSESPDIRRLLGVDGDFGEGLDLNADWAYRVVKQVGNYGEVFERDLGQASPLAMERRQNALWSKGGLMYCAAGAVRARNCLAEALDPHYPTPACATKRASRPCNDRVAARFAIAVATDDVDGRE